MNRSGAVPTHNDSGLQPERTIMAWGRTTMSLCVAGLIFLRWLPHYGLSVLLMVALCLSLAGGIYFTQRKRYARASAGVRDERIHADAVAVTSMTVVVFTLGVVGIIVVLGNQ